MARGARVAAVGATVQESIADRLRIWEVRKFCQVKPSLVHYSRADEPTPSSSEGTHEATIGGDGDYALTAMVRSLVYELEAAVAMISLLDETTQYFLSGAEKSSLSSARSTLESTKWYGCDTILHAGGLCPRTIGLTGGEILEHLHLDTDEQLKDLPIINGSVSAFRHYAGVPLVTGLGMNIGTVFVFKEGPAQSLEPGQAAFLLDTASQVMAQLEQAVLALEYQRMAKFNFSITSLLLRTQQHSEHVEDTVQTLSLPMKKSRQTASLSVALPGIADIYGLAADLLLDAFEFAAVFFQEVPLRSRAIMSPSEGGHPFSTDLCLAESARSGVRSPACLSATLTQRLLQCWPSGEVLYLATDSKGKSLFRSFGNTLTKGQDSEKIAIGQELVNHFPEAQQLLFTPLWDSVHNRVVAMAVGWVTDWSRVYTHTSDLSPMSAFCMTVITQTRRLEAQHMEKRKTDFLGSISHEMRSPLHGNLASVELLLETNLTDEQRGLLLNALNSGRQLLDTIDKILKFSHISDHDSGDLALADIEDSSTLFRTASNKDTSYGREELEGLCEEVIQHAVSRTSSIGVTSLSDNSLLQNRNGMPLDVLTQQSVPIFLDVSLTSQVYLRYLAALRTILLNLMTNAIKHTSSGCIRVSMGVDSVGSDPNAGKTMTLCVADCGKGIPRDFMDNHLFVPVSQANQLESGIGLGLSIVKRVVDSLGGTVQVDSDEVTGTTVTVALPVHTSQETTEKFEDAVATDSTNGLPSASLQRSPPLQAQIWPSTKWTQDERGKRCGALVHASLTCSLRESVQVQLDLWRPDFTPDILIVLADDIHELDSVRVREGIQRTLVLGSYAAKHGNQQVKSELTFPSYAIQGTFTPSKLRHAFETLFEDGSASSMHKLTESMPSLSMNYRPTQPREESQTSATAGHLESTYTTSHPAHGRPQPSMKDLAVADFEKSRGRKPRMLLVDDNVVNLRVLEMYVHKCEIESKIAVTGGKQAIEAFKLALEGSSGSPFDIIFMDLSMPNVSGFEATSTIRDIESQFVALNGGDMLQRTYIVALTGLVNSKDRIAANNAGVDKYMTKPATFKDIRDVVETFVEERQLDIKSAQR